MPNNCLRKKPDSIPDMTEPATAPARDGINKALNDLKSKFASLWCINVADSDKKNMVVKERQMAWCMLKFITITKNGTMSSPQPMPSHVAIIPMTIPKAMIKRVSWVKDISLRLENIKKGKSINFRILRPTMRRKMAKTHFNQWLFHL